MLKRLYKVTAWKAPRLSVPNPSLAASHQGWGRGRGRLCLSTHILQAYCDCLFLFKAVTSTINNTSPNTCNNKTIEGK